MRDRGGGLQASGELPHVQNQSGVRHGVEEEFSQEEEDSPRPVSAATC